MYCIPTPPKLRFAAQNLIKERDARQAADRDAIKRAEDFQTLAQQEALANRFPEAVALLMQAEQAYKEVSEEFPEEAQQKKRGARDVEFRMRDYKKQGHGQRPGL